MSNYDICEAYESGRMTWEDLLVVTGLRADELYAVLFI